MARKTFMELYAEKKVSINEIDDFIDRWHKSDEDIELYEFLGLSRKDYSVWISKGELNV